MNHLRSVFVELMLAIGLLAPAAMPQKPPAPTPPPPATRPASPAPSISQPPQPEVDLVLFLLGRVATSDGTPVPNDVLVERICNEKVRQQVYATTRGDFSMQMGSKFDSFLDASGDSASQEAEARKATAGGIPRRDLANCELRASAPGFRPSIVSLVDLTPSGGAVDLGAIVVQRVAKIKGMTVSAIPFKAPPNARKAYERGLAAEKNGKLAEARKYFEQAVEIYPKYASAWYRLGAILEKENRKPSARAAYTQATAIDTKFLPPYLSLASMAYEAENWAEVLQITGHILDLDLLNHGDLSGYVLDFDELNSASPYFYNAVANYKLNKFEEAEKSALKAERADLFTNFPQLHLLLADLFARKKNYAVAIAQLHTYLELVPHPRDEDLVREELAKFEQLNRPAPAGKKPVQN